MDLWEFNKVAAAVLLSLLVIVGANTAIPILYPEGGPGQVQVVEVQEDVQTAEAEPQAEEPRRAASVGCPRPPGRVDRRLRLLQCAAGVCRRVEL